MSDSRNGPPEFGRAGGHGGLTAALRVLLQGGTLDAGRSAAAFESIMTGAAHHGEIGALLALLATRVPTAAEILGAARVMRRHVDPVESSYDPADLVDTAGTGGAPKTFNVSTAAAVIAAACSGDPRPFAVAKHGNRSRTGRGSAEVLQRLGVNVDAGRATQGRCLDEARLCFCFAIHHHPAARHAMPVRQSLGFPTIFNVLGPLTNPAGARRQLMGVYDPRFLRPIAEALAALGTLRAMVVHADDGLDEISIAAPTQVLHVREGEVVAGTIRPQELGFRGASLAALSVPDLQSAARLVRGILEGETGGPPRDMAVLNAAATLVVADRAESLQHGVELAAAAITSGAAAETLRRLVEISAT